MFKAVSLVITGRFPITEESATNLAALHFQASYGDYNPEDNSMFEYILKIIKVLFCDRKSMDSYIPKDLLIALNPSVNELKNWVNTIKLCWVQLSGTSATECKSLYVQHMKTWQYYGSAIYSATVIFKENSCLFFLAKT